MTSYLFLHCDKTGQLNARHSNARGGETRQSNCSFDALLVSELSSIICETLLHLKVLSIVTTDLHQQFCHHLHPHHPHHHLFCHHHHDINCKSATSPPLVSVTMAPPLSRNCPAQWAQWVQWAKWAQWKQWAKWHCGQSALEQDHQRWRYITVNH